MKRFLKILVVLVSLAGMLAKASDINADAALKMVSEQQGQDPIIGIWTGSAGGYTWKTAIVRNPDSRGAQFVGVMLKPWPNFKKGEIHLRLSNLASDGTYFGEEKWKRNYFLGSWAPVKVRLTDPTHLVQSNDINFPTPIGAEWVLVRQTPPPQQERQVLRQAGTGQINTDVLSDSPAASSVRSDVFFWFDEDQPTPGTEVLEIVATARSYDAVLNILRQVRGSNTQVRGGINILETNYHPLTFRLGEWISRQPNPEKIGSVFYWDDEVLGETTPVMSFYMTKRAYQGVINAVTQFLNQPQEVQRLSPPQQKKRSGFLQALGLIAQGALEGLANYYTVVRPAEQTQLATQQMASAQSAQAHAATQQVYELQSLNQKLDQINTQMFLNRLEREGAEYSRLLERYRTGVWAH